MIDETLLIEDLNKAIDERNPLDHISVGFRHGVRHAVNIVNKQPKVGEWIPVSERLPEEGKTVIVKDRITGEVTLACLNIFDCFVFEDGRGHGASAWMPLPETYKE